MLKSKLKIFTIIILSLFCAGLIFFSVISLQNKPAEENAADEIDTAIEAALYRRTEFFGANAIVPFPTAEAFDRLAKVAEKFPAEPKIYLKLAEINEKLEKFDEAENNLNKFLELINDKLIGLNELAAFYNRRGEFEKQAEVFSKMIKLAPKEKRGEYFSLLINLAKTHRLEEYLKADFYKEFIAQDKTAFSILEQYADKLIEEKNFEEALKFFRENRAKFPEKKEYFLQKEVSVLISQQKNREAENVYFEAFEPNWSPELTEEFYSFLFENNRFKIYGIDLNKKFRQNPADFRTAIRLIHYLKYDGDSSENVILQLEKAKNEKKLEWSADELLTVSLHLISEGNADLASRFLYTLFLIEEAKPNGELRSKILYQLFTLLCDSENERIALTKGNLDFYRDIAASDTNPGITNGILSLIFADKNPSKELEAKEKSAVKLFNRAAAYRIFNEFKQEFPQRAELAQMYLDIIRLYTAEKDFEIAEKTLAEFEENFKDSADFPFAALKLADAFIAAGNAEKEREIYQKIMDVLGSRRDSNNPLIIDTVEDNSEISESNRGINIPSETDDNSDDNYYSPPKVFTDFISMKEPKISYRQVLNRFVASLAREKKSPEILALYTNEINKYSNEPMLYEDFLNWLTQTNFTDQQLEIYKNAIAKFQNKTWRDKLARWYIKNQRKTEFGELSHELIEKFSDTETQEYLWTFIDSNVLANPESFEGKLYFALYQKAHNKFPHNQNFVAGLLKYYQATKQPEEWRKLTAQYYFEMPEIRKEFLNDLSKRGELRAHLLQAIEKTKDNTSIETLPYKLFRADAAAHLSNFEQSVVAYRELNLLYPNNPEFSERLINFTRSFGQTDRKFLQESAEITHKQAEFLPASFQNRTRAGEVRAELGDYKAVKNEWQKLVIISSGEPQTHLETATVYWDYFQFDDALNVIKNLRLEMNNDTLYAFQTGAIYEAKNDKQQAISEYIKQIGTASDDEEVLLNISRTKNRLVQLSKRGSFNQLIKTAFENEKRQQNKNSTLILNYAHFLVKSEQKKEALNLLNKEVTQNNSEEFLSEAKFHYENLEDKFGERLVLRQLAKFAENKKNAISYQLELAEDFSDSGEKEKAAQILADLVKKYPTNYGVLSEADEFYWRLGFRENSLKILQNGVKLGRGKYKYVFKRKLASHFVSLDNFQAAEQILLTLHAENKGDTEVFDELANIFVHQNKPERLRKIAAETLSEIKQKSLESREMNDEIADWRRRLINSFTRLADYHSAIAQHIEIINRLPDDEENIESAIKYVRRYGGAEKLSAYYKKLAEDAYKNYRWMLVLARIYEADKDFEKSAENYKLAIHNQPEMVELYVALAGVYEKAKNTDAAIETMDKVLELTNETPNYLKRKIEILENAGRKEEAELVREKMTGIKRNETKNPTEEFAEAARLSETEKAKAIEAYRNAFNKLQKNPLESGLKSADIIGYAKMVRLEDSLDKITGNLWNLREKLIAEVENPNAENVGKARNLLATFDGALPEAIGNIAVQNATGNELAALYRNFETRIENQTKTDKHQTFALLQNLISRCGFHKLEEKILLVRKDEAFKLGNSENYHTQLRAVLNFYEERGDVARVLEVLETESKLDENRNYFEYPQKTAEIARILGNEEKELNALKNYFESPKKEISVEDNFVNSYFEKIYAKSEIHQLAETNTPHQIQLINFLISKNEKDAAHRAIENASFPQIWKQTKNAQIALALSEFKDEKAAYFQAVLQFAPIGELIKQNNENQLKGDEWFHLTYKFGNWLKLSENETHKNQSEKYLPAMTENRPKDAVEQFNLGVFYLENKDFDKSLEHLKIAQELNYSDRNLWANLGIAYFQNGETEKADETWHKLINGEQTTLEDCELFLKTLEDYGQAGKARENLFQTIVKFIGETPDENPSAALLIFLRKVSDSFREKSEKAEFWLKLINTAPEKLFLAKYVVEKSLVADDEIKQFYRILIQRSAEIDSWENDSEYMALIKLNWTSAETEAILDHENNFEISASKSEKLDWQQEYLDYLLKTNDFSEAKDLISEIEKSLEKTFPRPVWLRLAKFRVELESGVSIETIQKIKAFVGITDVLDAKQLNPPNLLRLNEIIKLLKAKNSHAEILDLREAFYSRSLALEKYNLSNFIGLAEAEFEKGNREDALKMLDLMIEISFDDSRENALRQLHSLDLIKTFSPKNPELFEIQAENNLDKLAALNHAAEISGNFGEIDLSVNYRQKLLAISPEDSINKIELARLLAEKQNFEAALKYLQTVISDRNALRNERWQALFVAGEIFGNNVQFWESLKNNLQDSEMSDAITAISLEKNGNFVEAIKILDESAFKSPQMLYLQAIIAKNYDQSEIALKAFSEAKNSNIDYGANFGFFEEKPVFQIIRLYLKSGKPLGALKMADSGFQISDFRFQISDSKFNTLADKSAENLAKSEMEILGILSKAAEETGELAKAFEFEKKRLTLISDEENRRISENRIFEIERKIAEKNNQPKIDFRIS